MVKECIMDAIRDSVPVEKILRAYVAQTEEEVNEDGERPGSAPRLRWSPNPDTTPAASATRKRPHSPAGSEPAH